MFSPRSSARLQTRPVKSRLMTRLAGITATCALLAVAGCDGMEVGPVPQCSVLQPNCSSFGPVPEPSSSVTAKPPVNTKAAQPPTAANPTDATPTN